MPSLSRSPSPPPRVEPPGGTASAASLLERALALVDEALVCAEGGDWERVAELDSRCREASQAMLDRLNAEGPEDLAERLLVLRARHHRLLELAEAQRERLAEQRRQSVRGRRGTRAYEDNR